MEYDSEILGIGDEELFDWETLLNFDDYQEVVEEKEDKRCTITNEEEGEPRGEQDEGNVMIYREIENELMKDDQLFLQEFDDANYVDSFLADVLPDVNSPHPSTASDENQHDVDAPPPKLLLVSSAKNNTNAHSQDADADNPVSKKQKRQLRNRDAAVRSRERKKMYVKDLESKTNYLESECRRLGRLLHCCYAENHALRYTLHMNTSGAGAPVAKQESAVLFLELLLLGSLLWLLGITCLLIVPILFQTTPGIVPRSQGNRGLENQAPREGGSDMFEICVPSSHVKSRRYRGLRTRMKPYLAVILILVK